MMQNGNTVSDFIKLQNCNTMQSCTIAQTPDEGLMAIFQKKTNIQSNLSEHLQHHSTTSISDVLLKTHSELKTKGG